MKISFNEANALVYPDFMKYSTDANFKENLLDVGIYVKSKKAFLVEINPQFYEFYTKYNKYILNNDEISKKMQLIKQQLEKEEKYLDAISKKFSFLYNFQKKIVAKSLPRLKIYKQMNLFLDVGTGKTIISLIISKVISKKTIIMCPASLVQNWVQEIKKFKLANDNEIIVLNKLSKVHRLLKYKQFLTDNTKKYLIVSYDTWKNDCFEIVPLLEDKFKEVDLVIFDEAHKIKNPSSKVHQCAYHLANTVKQILVLTATPVKNTILDLFTIVNLRGFLFAKKRSRFIKRYFKEIELKLGSKKIIKYEEKENIDILKLYSLVKHNSIFLKKEDVKEDLPEIVFQFIPYNVDKKTKNLFSLLKESISENMENSKNKKTSNNIIMIFQLLRLMELGPYFLRNSGSKLLNELILKKKLSMKEYDGINFYPTLKEIIEEIPQNKKIILFTTFKLVAEYLKDKLEEDFKAKAIAITGDTKDKIKYVNLFNKSDEYRFLIATDTINYGVSLPQIEYLINVDLPLTYSDFKQRVGRIDRITSKNKNKVIISLYGDLIGENIKEIVENKKDLHNKLEILNSILK